MRKLNKRVAQTLLSLSVIPFCVACLGISQKDYPEVRYYSLDPKLPATASTQSVDAVVSLKSFSSSHSAADPQFLLRQEGGRVERDFYNRFFTSPTELIEDAVFLWVHGGGAFESVMAYDANDAADYIIAGHVVKLEGDFSETPSTAVLAIQFYVTSSDGTGTPLMRSYEESQSITNATAGSLVEGWNKGLTLILDEFESDLIDHVQSK